MTADIKEVEDGSVKRSQLHFQVNEMPGWKLSMLLGCQQATVCLSSLLVVPFLMSELACAGDATIDLRVKLIAATFVTSGVATILQSTVGLRLAVLMGPAFVFLPPLFAYSREHPCPHALNATVPEEEWRERLQTVSGSLLVACCSFVVIGATGAVGLFSKYVGPLTTAPVLVLLSVNTIPTIDEKLSLHWVSIVMLAVVIFVAVYLEALRIPFPRCSRSRPRFTHVRFFGMFPYLISVAAVWFVCFILTITGAEPEGGAARTDKPAAVRVLQQAPWVSVPAPAFFGAPRLDIGLMLGFLASTVSSTVENLGAYYMAARVSEQRKPPRSTVNRAIIIEGLSSMLAALMGVSSGCTSYNDNIALLHLTKVASRITMQICGSLLIILGLFTKVTALLGSIPEPVVGGVLTMGMSMIVGVALAQLQLVDMHVTRNVSVLGLSLLLGMIIPAHFERVPLKTGNAQVDSTLGMLLTIRMLIGGIIAFVLDNTVPGVTRQQRGLADATSSDSDSMIRAEDDGYAFPHYVNRVLVSFPLLSKLPFLPSQKCLNITETRRNLVYPAGDSTISQTNGLHLP